MNASRVGGEEEWKKDVQSNQSYNNKKASSQEKLTRNLVVKNIDKKASSQEA